MITFAHGKIGDMNSPGSSGVFSTTSTVNKLNFTVHFFGVCFLVVYVLLKGVFVQADC